MASIQLLSTFAILLAGNALAQLATRVGEAPGLSPFLQSTPTVPMAFGVNIHINSQPRAGEMEMIAASGVKWVRTDFDWASTELEKGVYNFNDYDLLTASLRRNDLGVMYILGYSNNLYDGGLSPYTDSGRTAFAAWAAAAAKHFEADNIIWEMYNEPNIGFWKPTPKVQDYVALALSVGIALKATVPAAVYAGPATSRVDFAFLENCFGAGLLKYWDAVTVHPYRDTDPEDATVDFANLRSLINKYAPKGNVMPIISSEWGYSSRYKGFDVERQSKSLPRMWLNNIMNNVVLSIYYDWQNDGTNQTYVEHHFGMVYYAYHQGREPVHDAKPAYGAARTLTSILAGMHFSRRLAVKSNNVGNATSLYAVVFSKATTMMSPPLLVLVAWCSERALVPCDMTVVFGDANACYYTVDYAGQQLPELCATAGGALHFVADDAPLYFVPTYGTRGGVSEAQTVN